MKSGFFTFAIGACWFAATVTAASSSLPATAAADSMASAYVLQEVVIYGPQTLNKTSMSTTLDAAQIRFQAASTVADLLRSDAGLEITAGPKAETETRIRGFPARDILVLVDGRPINPGYYGKVDLAMLPLDNVERVSVIKGPASVAYGPNGLGGVISVLTRNGLDRPRTTVEGEFGDLEYRRLSVNHNRRIRQFNYWMSLYEHHSAGYRLSHAFEPTSIEDGGRRRGSSYQRIGSDMKIGFQPSIATQYAVAAGYHWAEKDVPPTIYSWDSPTYRTFPFWARVNASLSGGWQLKPSVELKAVLFGDAYHDRLRSYTGPVMRPDQMEFDSKLENWTAGVSVDSKIEAGNRHWLHTGFSFKQDRVSKKSDLDEPWIAHRTQTGSVFLQDNYRPWSATEITAGVSGNVFVADKGKDAQSAICPMICARQTLPLNTVIRGSWSSAIRVPTLHDLYSEDSGNPDLKPEQANKFEIGGEAALIYDTAGISLSVDAAFFHSDLRNLIYRSAKTERFQNIRTARLQGFEVQSVCRVVERIEADFAYTWLNPDTSSEELMEETPPQRWRMSLTYKARWGMRLHYTLGYFDERTTALASRTLDAYQLHRLSVHQPVSRQVTVSAAIQNLLDADYEEELGYPASGRFLTIGLRWEK